MNTMRLPNVCGAWPPTGALNGPLAITVFSSTMTQKSSKKIFWGRSHRTFCGPRVRSYSPRARGGIASGPSPSDA
jgi:hypothetical protein